jgi:hypothetical protein
MTSDKQSSFALPTSASRYSLYCFTSTKVQILTAAHLRGGATQCALYPRPPPPPCPDAPPPTSSSTSASTSRAIEAGGVGGGTQFTCFTSKTVQILTTEEVRGRRRWGQEGRVCVFCVRPKGPQFACFASTKVQILTPVS